MKKRLLFILSFFALISISAQCWNQISSGTEHSAGIKADGTLYTWGNNQGGQLGSGNLLNNANIKQVGTASDWVMVSASFAHTVALKTDGTIWSWGTANGQVTSFSSTLLNPTQIGTSSDWVYVNNSPGATFGIKSNGELWTWGSNIYDRLGRVADGLPAKVPTIGNQLWVEAGGSGTHSVGLKSDGTIWTWGNGADGRLGHSSLTNLSTPTQVGTATNWKSIKAGEDHTIAIKTDGTLYAWGKNDVGQLGTGSAASPIIFPVQIGTATNWNQISAGSYHNLAIKTNGSLWSWGSNFFGQLGTGNNISYNAPIQVGTDLSWTKIDGGNLHSSAIKNDNSGWTWGNNGSGRLGDGASTNRNTPFGLTCPTGTLSSSGFSQNDNDFQIYPNPAKSFVTVSSKNQLKSVEIFDAQGRKVLTINKKTFNISHLLKGFYTVKILNHSGIETTKKLIVE